MSLDIALQIRYTNGLAPIEAERQPLLMVYLDGNFDREVCMVPFEENDGGNTPVRVRVQGQAKRPSAVPTSARLVFWMTAQTQNDVGSPCRVDAGVATLRVNELRAAQTHDLPLRMNSVGFDKGALRVSVLSINNSEPIQFKHSLIEAPINHVQSQLRGWLDEFASIEAGMPNTIDGTTNYRCPIYYGEFGMVDRQVPLPVAAFTLYEIPETSVAYWDNALDVVLARRGISDYASQPLAEQAAIMVSMQSLLVQSLDYMGDKADRNKRTIEGNISYNAMLRQPCENFGNALTLLAPDCEDGANGIDQCKLAFESIEDFSGSRHRSAMEHMRQISQQYISMLTLAVVTAGQVNRASKEAPKGAHMYSHYLPAHYVKQCMGAEAAAKLPWREPMPSWAAQLPTLVGEGTGMYEPLGRARSPPELQAYRQVFATPSLGAALAEFKKPIIHAPDEESTFFIGALVGVTNYWLAQGASTGGIWYGYGDFSRGALHTDLAQRSPRVRMRPHPEFPPAVLRHMQEVIKVRCPALPLTLTVNHPAANPHLDRLAPRATTTTNEADATTIDVFVRDYQLNEGKVERIAAAAAQAGVELVDYRLEPISDHVYDYRLRMRPTTKKQ